MSASGSSRAIDLRERGSNRIASTTGNRALAKAGEFWAFTYLFAKRDRANIDNDELLAFWKLSELYRRKTKADLEAEIEVGALLEIDHGD